MKKKQIFSLVIVNILAIFFILYLLELLLIFFLKEIDYKHILNLRLNLYKEKILTENIALVNTPGFFGNFYLFGGHPNIKTLYCKEGTEEFTFYNSDRYGFNNDDNVWDNDVDIFLIGDSFAKGACVNREHNIAMSLKTLLNKKIINLGMDDSGSLEQYASFLEYSNEKKFKLLIWIFSGSNDFGNLEKDKDNHVLIKYLENNKFNQNLISNQNQINEFFDIQKKNLDERMKNFSYKEKYNNLKNFLVLKQLKPILKYQVFNRINQILFKNATKTNNKINIEKNTDTNNKIKIEKNIKNINNKLSTDEVLMKTFTEAKKLSLERNYELLIVYNPEFSLKSNPSEYLRFKKIMSDLDMGFIDLKKEFNLRKIDHINLLTFKNGHFSKEGYKIVSKILSEKINQIFN
ncbi:hypothetical protein [Candidatus Pelagibacter sp. Uisw_136]|uniref:hypothetical protein n=1 Tax=Candidatus Pelagibacter sp. Uisw_136 TaxID=3230991 RepID=UPI0039ED28AA